MSLRSALVVGSVVALAAGIAYAADAMKPADWSMNATIIEACSCPMFCQCYFNGEPSGHMDMSGGDMSHAEHYCKFNNAYKVNKGNYGKTKLDGVKFWVAGDLGGDFSKGQMDWGALTFDPSVTPEQRQGVETILGFVYPVKWNSFSVASDQPMKWSATRDDAVANLDSGRAAEVVLKKNQGMTADPIVIKNLKYWGVPRNDGFVLMQNTVEAYRTGDKPFEYKGTNGFMITLDITSKDVASAAKN
jgi:hypothetical protein